MLPQSAAVAGAAAGIGVVGIAPAVAHAAEIEIADTAAAAAAAAADTAAAGSGLAAVRSWSAAAQSLTAAQVQAAEAPTASLQSSYSDSIRGPTEGPCARSNPMATLWWDPLPQFAAPAAAAAAAVPAGVERASGRAAEQLSFHHSLPCLRPKFGQLMRLRCCLHPSLENFRPKPESKQNKRRVSWV